MGDRQKNFCKYIKYPRTYHVPWSQPGRESDKYLKDVSCFLDKNVVVTEKRDGENFTLYDDYCHARSLDGRHHPSRSWIKNFHAKIAHNIPENMRICGENLYARHTVEYNDLQDYFEVFSIWINDTCLS